MLNAERVFGWFADRPVPWLLAVLLPALALGAFVPTLQKDTRNEAFMASDHPAVVYREKVRDTFGLTDPVVIAVVNDGPQGVFTPETLGLVIWLTEQMKATPGIDPERVTSLATEKSIRGSETDMLVERLLEAPPADAAAAEAVRREALRMEVYRGSLVAEDGTATAVVGELIDAKRDATRVYATLAALVERAPTHGEQLHIAGEGAASAYLGAYIDRDASRLNPLAGLVIVAVLFLAYRTVAGVLIPVLIVIVSLAATLGSMAALGVPFYVITSALPVIMIGVTVCEAIHIIGLYYEKLAAFPDRSRRDLVVETMKEMWRPCALTSLTSVAGCIAGLSSSSPPMQAFGIFSSVGVLVALVATFIAIPALLMLLRAGPSPAFRPSQAGPKLDVFGAGTAALGRVVVRFPGSVLVFSLLLSIGCLALASRLVLDDERIRYFQPTEAIHTAILEIDRRLGGSSYFDLVVEADRPDGLLDPANLKKVEELERFVAGLPHVKKTTSIVDYVKQMNQAMSSDRPEAYAIPDDEALIAQYFLLYAASADPADFEEMVDGEYRLANIRVGLDRGRWSDFTRIVHATESYIDRELDGGSVGARFAGPAYVSHHRAIELAVSHPLGVVISFVSVLGMTVFGFRSLLLGLLSLVPVVLAVLMVYALMGGLDIWLGSGTGMTTSIAVGLAVDFAIHMIDRVRTLMHEEGLETREALRTLFPSTGRALFFNLAALLLGFGVLAFSAVPSLMQFGLLVVVCVLAAFIGSLTILPAMLLLWPRLLARVRARHPLESAGERPWKEA